MNDYFGNVIKELRTLKNITQTQLSEGICTVKHLSRIENNLANPTLLLLSEFSKRLGNELFDYIPYISEPNAYQLKREIQTANDLFSKQKHDETLDLLLNSEILNNTDCTIVNQESAWLMGALSNYVEVPITISIEYYEYILRKTREFGTIYELFDFPLSPLELRIMNSIIVLYLKDSNFEVAETLLVKSINNYERHNTHLTDDVYSRFLYNLSRLYLELNFYPKSVSVSKKGIDHCLKLNKTAYLADLCNIYGRASYKADDIEEGKKYLRISIELYKLVNAHNDYEKMYKTLKERYDL
ncbi:helix-turn-helix transcriptional regulator [Acidaminobacter sp. JC074]|uniref:helix-turn-helix domain-containing protein n=1 Tax=Acidaminobacter sp. JC074 TaxID=2530199 RepID=UPI001F0E7815|nr:helix-turn-helix domain-containing protein [Acidaminobacter sp. JC074]MCH4891123.1 helix-turn-helix transcriptional regulator [Acidaminobacter sp. JC074]